MDEAVQYAVPAITLGYSVSNDTEGKFIFENDECKIYHRQNTWYLRDATNERYEYHWLIDALKAGAIEENTNPC